ncbi:zinc-dependent alcohol dehydrogenase [Nesterenkonia flava]|uniref:Zinc-binding alcohol dehydrogenase n=1 Tax=Nesterenkonia flava TaxID=469799 RepID=A0ABU1FSI9_9MICC|nr:zinc-binding alcohol dehydrogenase [Nesterenkonia flava]MDR5711101.1 zinc-binding alcohol dehydrogenase [Nesterenkonia flava]
MERAQEYWTQAPWQGTLRSTEAPSPGDGEILIRTEVSGISRGTETLVHRGEVPDRIAELMRAPFQLGSLPAPVSHGYLNVGEVLEGPESLRGRRVFTLAGHRSHIVVPEEAAHPVPDNCPSSRALLAGLAEVALNGIWEAQISLAERVAVVGGGLVGLCTALLVSQLSPQRVEVLEVDERRRAFISALGLTAVAPEDASSDHDVVIHTSATEAGLSRALEITGDDGTLVELSWYGERAPQVPLGADFHARRLRIIGSQVGEVAAPKRLRRSRAERLSTALGLLDERFDQLITGSSPLDELPRVMDDFALGADWTRSEMLHVVTYGERDD